MAHKAMTLILCGFLFAFPSVAESAQDTPDTHAQAGVDYMKLNLQDKAAEEFEKALALNPSHLKALQGLALIRLAEGRLDESILLWKKVLEQAPTDAGSLGGLGAAYYQSKRLEEAEVPLRRALVIRPHEPIVTFLLASTLTHLERPEEALPFSEEAVKLNPSSAEARFTLAMGYSLKGLHGESIPHYEKAIELDPKIKEAHNNLGLAYRRAGRLDEAEASIQRALTLDPAYTDAQANLAALESERDPTSVDNRLNKAGDLVQAKKYDEALAVLEEAQKKYPSENRIRAVKASALFLSGDKSAASRELEALHQTSGATSESRQLLATIYREEKRFPEEIAELQKAAALDADAAFELGMAYYAAERYEEGVAALETYLTETKEKDFIKETRARIIQGVMQESVKKQSLSKLTMPEET